MRLTLAAIVAVGALAALVGPGHAQDKAIPKLKSGVAGPTITFLYCYS